MRRCPTCGTQLPTDSPEGICPGCLLRCAVNSPVPAPAANGTGGPMVMADAIDALQAGGCQIIVDDLGFGPAAEPVGGDGRKFDAIELYSCFPCVPKMARRTLGLGRDVQPTVTGGLTFFGAPLNTYMTHAACAMVRKIRSGAKLGLLYGQGGFVTKHHGLVLSREMPREALAAMKGRTAWRKPSRGHDFRWKHGWHSSSPTSGSTRRTLPPGLTTTGWVSSFTVPSW